MAAKKIKDTSKALKRIKDTVKPMRRIEHQEVTELLGAQKATRLKVGGSPISAKASRLLATMKNKPEREEMSTSEEVLAGSQK